MEWWKALILGLVQGFTEFLPVSSSGHLVLFQAWLNVESESILFFDVMLHVATLVAVCIVLYKEIWALLKKPLSKPVLFLIIATIPAGIVGITLEDVVGGFFEGTKYLWIFFLLSAAVLLLSDIMSKKYAQKEIVGANGANKQSEQEANLQQQINAPLFSSLNYGNVVAMGLAQACAIFPGLTRSGSTIAAGVIAKGDRKDVAKFSFLMSIPIILASALLQGIKLGVNKTPIDVGAGSIIIGMIAATVSGYFAVKWMLKLVQKCKLKWFSLYLVIIAIVVFINNFVKIW
ncbi:MAG: undecaprenyl-diphosphate phosphatase [Clostridia bacterium]